MRKIDSGYKHLRGQNDKGRRTWFLRRRVVSDDNVQHLSRSHVRRRCHQAI